MEMVYMLSYVDIFNEIMKPIGMKYHIDIEVTKNIEACVPKNQFNYWHFLYPREVSDIFSFSLSPDKTDIFSSVKNKSFDRVSYSEKKLFRDSIIEGKCILKTIYDHLNDVLDDCAAVETLIVHESKSTKSFNINSQILSDTKRKHNALLLMERDNLKERLRNRLLYLMPDILSDRRYNDNLKKHINVMIEDNPVRVLGLLSVFALFSEIDEDEFFVSELIRQYCCDADINPGNHVAEAGDMPHDITSFIDVSRKDVLYRDDEIEDIIETLKTEKIVTLTGDGGVGKTTIARRVFSMIKSNYDICAWINYNRDIMTSMISDIEMGYSDETMIENDIQMKWNKIKRLILQNNKKSKLFVIDNVDYIDGIQSPMDDEDLSKLSGWENVKIIFTSRIQHQIAGLDNKKIIKLLGDRNDCEKCVELFYHYNPEAEMFRKSNYNTVEKICELAGYNTMAIELLAKACFYDVDNLELFYNNLQNVGFRYAEDVVIETYHDYNHISIKNEDGVIEEKYYNHGSETAATQLMKLFNIKFRTEIERMILWDFHCLPEAERVSRKELEDWLGYSIREIDSLRKEGWIKYEGGFFFMHPLIKQAVTCAEKSDDWFRYWQMGEDRRKQNISLISGVNTHTIFSQEDDFITKIRKIHFVDNLSYEGRFLSYQELIYLADNARECGAKGISIRYYKLAYEKLTIIVCESGIEKKENLLPYGRTYVNWLVAYFSPIFPVSESFFEYSSKTKIEKAEHKIMMMLLWKSCYYYGYMLSLSSAGMEEAEEYLTQSLTIFRIYLGSNLSEEEKLYYCGMNEDRLAYVMTRKRYKPIDCSNLKKVLLIYMHALEKRRSLVNSFPDKIQYMSDLADTLDNVGILLVSFPWYDEEVAWGKTEESKVLFDHLNQYVLGKPFYYTNAESEVINRLIKRKAEAKKVLDESLFLRKQVLRITKDIYSAEVAWADISLCIFMLHFSDELNMAKEYALEAIQIYRELDKILPSVYLAGQARAYIVYGKIFERNEEYPESIKAYEQAIELYERLGDDYHRTYDIELKTLRTRIKGMRNNKDI